MLNRRIISLAATALLIISILAASAYAAVPEPSESFYVYDEADVISDETEKEIVEQNDKLCQETGAQIVVCTVKTTGGESIREYAGQIFSEWAIGDSGKNNGILVLLATEDEDYWVIQGSGIEDRLTSGDIKIMLDGYLEPSFAAKNYDDGVRSLFSQLLSSVTGIYGVNLSEVTLESSGNVKEARNSGGFAPIVLSVFVIVIAAVIFIVIIIAVIRSTSVKRHIRGPVRPIVMIPPAQRRPQRRGPVGPRPGGMPNPSGPRSGSAPRPSGPRPGSAPRPSDPRPGSAPRPSGPRPGSMPRPSGPRPGSAPRSSGPRPGSMPRSSGPRSGGGGSTRGGGAGRR